MSQMYEHWFNCKVSAKKAPPRKSPPKTKPNGSGARSSTEDSRIRDLAAEDARIAQLERVNALNLEPARRTTIPVVDSDSSSSDPERRRGPEGHNGPGARTYAVRMEIDTGASENVIPEGQGPVPSPPGQTPLSEAEVLAIQNVAPETQRPAAFPSLQSVLTEEERTNGPLSNGRVPSLARWRTPEGECTMEVFLEAVASHLPVIQRLPFALGQLLRCQRSWQDDREIPTRDDLNDEIYLHHDVVASEDGRDTGRA